MSKIFIQTLKQSMVFPVVMYRCESWTIKKAERWRIYAFKLWCWRKFFRVSWTARSNHTMLKEISPEYSYWSSITLATWCEELTHWKRPWCWEKAEGRRREQQRMRRLDGITDSKDICLSKLLELVMTGKPGVLQSMGSQRVGHDWAT